MQTSKRLVGAFGLQLAIFLLVGCTSSPAPAPVVAADPYARPAWVDFPEREGQTVGLGIAKSHFKGTQAQRALAIERATEEIARQMGVDVTSQSVTRNRLSGSSASSSFDSMSVQSVDGTRVTAKIKHEWKDLLNDVFYVLMVLE